MQTPHRKDSDLGPSCRQVLALTLHRCAAFKWFVILSHYNTQCLWQSVGVHGTCAMVHAAMENAGQLVFIETVQSYPLNPSSHHLWVSRKSSSSSEHLSPLSDTPHELKGSFLWSGVNI